MHKAHLAFKQRGKSGLWVSDLFPHLADVSDELTVIRSLWSGASNHTPATYEAVRSTRKARRQPRWMRVLTCRDLIVHR